MKIVFVGAGSVVFVKNLVGDCMLTPGLEDSEFALLDIDRDKLFLTEQMLHHLNKNINDSRAVIKAYECQKEALKNADYVITTIQVGGYDLLAEEFDIAIKYHLEQTFGDTLGIGGIFRGLRTIPVMLDIVKDMEEVCPNAWLLNYTNPMAIVSGAIQKAGSIKCIGLCHSVQVCSKELLEGLDMNTEHITDKIAGINHQSWLLDIRQNGKDIYPEIRARIEEADAAHPDLVRYEILRQFGYYVTESSLHSSEYLPYFIKRSYPELAGQYHIKTDMYKNWAKQRIDYWNEIKETILADTEIMHTKSREYASHIILAMLTDSPCKIAANVLNKGYIANLPDNACVEVPCFVDANGINPCFIGELPLACAALNQSNINVQNLAVQAALTGNRNYIYQAALLDPHTSAELSIKDIRALCDELILKSSDYLRLTD